MELEANVIHVWQLDLTQLVDRHEQCLSVLNANEQARAVRYKVAAPRKVFILVRGALRYILADYVGLAPEVMPLGVTAKGKPVLDAPYQDIHFNVSHTQGLALIAVSNVQLGVDVERVTPLDDLASIARRYFSGVEWGQLSQLKDGEQLTAFYRVWTRKEAYIKARGEGLGYPLADFDVSVTSITCGSIPTGLSLIRLQKISLDKSSSETRSANLFLADRHDPQATEQWHIQAIDVPAKYTAALAVHSPSALPVMQFTENAMPW